MTEHAHPPSAGAVRFRALTDELGVAAVARELEIDPSLCSHLRSGKRLPSLKLAVRIARFSAGRWAPGPIHCDEWTRAAAATAEASAEERASTTGPVDPSVDEKSAEAA